MLHIRIEKTWRENMMFKSIFDIEYGDEVAAALFPKRIDILVHGISILCIAMALIGFVIDKREVGAFLTIGCLLLLIFNEIGLLYNKKKYAKNFYKQFQETYKTNEIQYQYSLEENILIIQNMNNGAKEEMEYNIFKKIIDTDHYMLLITKGGQCVTFSRQAAGERNLKLYFMSKCNVVYKKSMKRKQLK